MLGLVLGLNKLLVLSVQDTRRLKVAAEKDIEDFEFSGLGRALSRFCRLGFDSVCAILTFNEVVDVIFVLA